MYCNYYVEAKTIHHFKLFPNHCGWVMQTVKRRNISLINSQTFKNFASSVCIPRGVSNGGGVSFCNLIIKTKQQLLGSAEYNISFFPNSLNLSFGFCRIQHIISTRFTKFYFCKMIKSISFGFSEYKFTNIMEESFCNVIIKT